MKTKRRTVNLRESQAGAEMVRQPQPIRRVEPRAAGLDVGAKEIAACVSDGEGNQIVRVFGTYTRALHELADWLTQHGVVSVAQTLLAEVGSDLHQFKDAKHFCSWLGLSPHNQITGGKVIASHRLKNHNRAGQALIHAAASNIRARTQFGAFYRRLKGRLGESQALIATAHKLARVVYVLLKEKQPYQGLSEREYEEKFRQREMNSLQRRAARLGLSLVPAGAVS